MSFPKILFSFEYSTLFLLIIFFLLKCFYSLTITTLSLSSISSCFSSSLIGTPSQCLPMDPSSSSREVQDTCLYHPLNIHSSQGFINHPCADSFQISEYSLFIEHLLYGSHFLSLNLLFKV